MKKMVVYALAGAITASALAGCSSKTEAPAETQAAQETKTEAASEAAKPAADGSVYYLNFKPEQDEQWQALAKSYTEQTLSLIHI